MFITNSLLLDLLGVFISLVIALIAYVKWKYTHWARLGIEYPEPKFPFGNVKDIITMKLTPGQGSTKIYNQMKARGAKCAGFYFFHLPIFMPIDPDLIKSMMQADFGHFVDHGIYCNEADEPLTAHLFAIEGAKWKSLRSRLSPAFTSSKMKMMFPIVVKTSQQLINVLDGHSHGEPVEFVDISSRLTTDIIGTCAFGLDCNTLRNPKMEIREQIERAVELSSKDMAVMLFSYMFPNATRFLGIKIIRKPTTDFFMGVVRETVEYRENNGIEREDFLQLMIRLKNGDSLSDNPKENISTKSRITIEELAAQVLLFYMAGFETSSSTLSFCLYELALNEDVQDRLRDEVNAVLGAHNGDVTYESMAEMRFMEAVINETLRIHPPVPNLNRKCTKDYNIPGTDIVLKKGTLAFVPVQALQNDPEYYPNPEVFDPDRFSDENKSKRPQFTHLPFGDGPRVCIGLRFGVTQIKVALSILLRNYKFRLNPRTKVPVNIGNKHFLNRSTGGIWLNVVKIPT